MRHCSFDSSNSKQDFYRGAGCTEKFYEDLEKHATEVINYQKKEILPLIDEEIGSYNNKKFCHICKKKFYDVDDNNENSSDDSNGVIAVMKMHLTLKGFMVMLQDLKMVMSVMNLILEVFTAMLQSLILIMMMGFD